MMTCSMLWQFLTYILLLREFAVGSFPENSPAISTTTINDVPTTYFTGSGDQRLHCVQGMKRVKIAGKDYFAITGRETLYLIQPDEFSSIKGEKSSKISSVEVYTWKTDEDAKKMCALKGQSEENCENYIRVVEPMDLDGNRLMICGTNSYDPKCQFLSASLQDGHLSLNESSEHFSGTEICPFGPDQTGASLYAGSSLYSATASDFNGRSYTIIRSYGDLKHLRTPKFDDKVLNEPHFVKMVEDEERILIFMNEMVKTDHGDVRMVAYVAQVCKNDQGGQHVLVRQWTKFEKTRLNCSWNGFYFDQLQDVSETVDVKTSAFSGRTTKTIYATFTTPEHSVPGSAVCAFTLDSIHDALLGKFHDDRGGSGRKSDAPTGPKHPGNCPRQRYTNNELLFLKSHPLLEDQARGNLLSTYVGERWTAISVDSTAGPDRNWTVYFVGTDNGEVLRYLSPTGGLNNSVLLRRQDVYAAERCDNSTDHERKSVKNIVVDAERSQVVVSFKFCVISLPLRSCDTHKCKRSCLESADPYCGWNGSKCIDYTEFSSTVEQHIFEHALQPTSDVDSMCSDESVTDGGKYPGVIVPSIGDSIETDQNEETDGDDLVKNGTGIEDAGKTEDGDSSISSPKTAGLPDMAWQVVIIATVSTALLFFFIGICCSKLCCKGDRKNEDSEKQENSDESLRKAQNNKDSLCKKLMNGLSPNRSRKGPVESQPKSLSQSTIADNQYEDPLVNSKLDEYCQRGDLSISDTFHNMNNVKKDMKPRIHSTSSASQITEPLVSHSSKRRGSAQPFSSSLSSMGNRARPNNYATAPRIRHTSGNRTSDPSEYTNAPTLRADKTTGRQTSRHSTPLPVVGYPVTPNSLKDYSFNFNYENVDESTEHLLDGVKDVIEQQQRRSQEMETVVEESPDDARLRHESSDSGKGSSPRNSVQTEEHDKISTLSRNRPDMLVMVAQPQRQRRKRLNSEPTSPTIAHAPLPPSSVHNPVGRSTSMRSQHSVSYYPSSRTRSESFSSHHSQPVMGPPGPIPVHQMTPNGFMAPPQANIYATLPMNPQMVSSNNGHPPPEHYNRQISYDTYSPSRYPPLYDQRDHPAMNMPDRFSSLPTRSQAHRSSKKQYPPGQYPQVQMRRGSGTPQVPQYMKQLSVPVNLEQQRPGRAKYVPPPTVPGPLPE